MKIHHVGDWIYYWNGKKYQLRKVTEVIPKSPSGAVYGEYRYRLEGLKDPVKERYITNNLEFIKKRIKEEAYSSERQYYETQDLANKWKEKYEEAKLIYEKFSVTALAAKRRLFYFRGQWENVKTCEEEFQKKKENSNEANQ